MFRKPLIIFYLLLIYSLAELIWWGLLLVRSEPRRIGMIIGEGSFFLMILFVGAFYFHRLLNKEKAMHQQQRNFLLSVTHELKSPLASVQLYLQTILMRDLDKEKREQFIRSSIDDIGRLDDLVENMLLATRIENRSYTFPKEVFDFSELTQSLVDRLVITVQDKRKIDAGIDPGILINGDRFALGSMINNLLENAVKYADDHSRIGISLKKSYNQIIFKVTDEGQGIADTEKFRIFEKFYRSGNELTRTTKGTGLGLFIVKQVVENHRAKIFVRNNSPKGTIFEVVLNV